MDNTDGIMKAQHAVIAKETKAIASVVIDGADEDRARSFAETYASNPEPTTPVCITYYWKVFRAKGASALTSSISASDATSNAGAPPLTSVSMTHGDGLAFTA
jgi:hypothetical protein